MTATGATSRKHYDLTGFTVRVATLDDWRQVTEWGNGEGWNIGFQDAECFFTIDPEGFFIGRVGHRPVSAVSLVNYSDEYAVWGHYLVDPELRGRGYGRGVCKVASLHSGSRVTAGDAMPVQVANYSKDGSKPVHDTVHRAGPLARAGRGVEGVERIRPEHLDVVAAYDGECFLAYRREFLSRWLFADGHVGHVQRDGGRITGYGVIRPGPVGHRIGPLFADASEIAEDLFDALTAHLAPGDEVSVFAPDTQDAGARLFAARGLTEQFRVVRMYRGVPPKRRAESIYAIGSLEVG